jgi:protein required for attachment to host cells
MQSGRSAALEERTDLAMRLESEDAYEPQDRPPRAHDSVGAGRHAMDKGGSLHEQEEENFLRRVADRINEAAKHQQFAHLAIAAPPRALGLLRPLLSDAASGALRADLDKDVVDEGSEALRARLMAILR